MKKQVGQGFTSSDLPVVLDTRVVTGTGGGPDKTILNSPRFLEPMGYRNLSPTCTRREIPALRPCGGRPKPGMPL